jgi:hypothetical protein
MRSSGVSGAPAPFNGARRPITGSTMFKIPEFSFFRSSDVALVAFENPRAIDGVRALEAVIALERPDGSADMLATLPARPGALQSLLISQSSPCRSEAGTIEGGKDE